MALTPMYNRQMALKYIYAFYTGEIDYKEGPLMKAAYGSIQKKYGLTVDKIYGPKTDAVLRDLVKQLQTLLVQRGYDLTVDGLFGPATLEAVKAFQKKNGRMRGLSSMRHHNGICRGRRFFGWKALPVSGRGRKSAADPRL